MRENTIQYMVVDAHLSELNTTRNYRTVGGGLLRVSETNRTQNPPLEDRLQLFMMTQSLSASWL